MLTNLFKTPWPWFGGKADAAPAVWEALGDVDHYVEPFAGSLAVLLRRPHECNRTYRSETVNDLDGLLCNACRSMQLSPDAMADAASWTVCEADLMARHLALVKWREDRQLEHLMADPLWHDPVMGGWWAWGQSCWIGSGWASGTGPWVVGADGRIEKRSGTREPGVSRQRPHLVGNGQGVNHAGTREPGVKRQRPHLGDDGIGVNRPQSREPGVGGEPEFHPMTMPELRRWFQFLSARLRHVRIINGDWQRVCTGGALKILTVRQDKGSAGIFLDPPYGTGAGRSSDLYSSDDLDVAAAVADWCLANGSDKDYRIVLAGFSGEGHERLEAAGWTTKEWFKSGFLKGGMAQQGAMGTNQNKERLWLSPHCLRPGKKQLGLF
jgi:DNA adenine methylase